MQQELAALVHPVLNYGLYLKERLEQGTSLHLGTEQILLKKLLLTERESKQHADFGGEASPGNGSGRSTPAVAGDQGPALTFLGIRYALVCWLDELFTVDSPWQAAWSEQKLELAIYGTNDRAWKFWEQARLAEMRPGHDVLETFYLCVMLGFRGDLVNDPTRLEAWVAAVRTRLAKSQSHDWPAPPRLDPLTHVPPLRGREQLRRMVLAGGMLLLLLMPVIAFLVIYPLAQ